MKISNSKKELARIISENDGWRNGEFAAQDGDGGVGGYEVKPEWDSLAKYWWREASGQWFFANKIKNHHQTILSRDEYFHLYPAPDADGWIEWNGGECPVERGTLLDVRYANGLENIGVSARTYALETDHIKGSVGSLTAVNWDSDLPMSGIVAYRLHQPEHTETEYKDGIKPTDPAKVEPTIESLAADYRSKLAIYEQAQEELNSHRCGVEAALSRLQLAGWSIGLSISPQADGPKNENEPLNITDWRDLRVGDVVEYISGTENYGYPLEGSVCEIDSESKTMNIRVATIHGKNWCREWRFIRRP